MNFALEEYGAGSRCFEQSEPLTRNITSLNQFDGFERLEGKRGGACYKVIKSWCPSTVLVVTKIVKTCSFYCVCYCFTVFVIVLL